MDTTARTAPRDSEIINELLSRVKHGFDSPNSPLGLRYHQPTVVTRDAWIRQPQQPYGLRNHKQTTVTGDAWIGQPQQTLGAHIS
jgi:hypothetical protein